MRKLDPRADAARFVGASWRDALVIAIALLKPTEGDGAGTDARRLLAHAMAVDVLALIKEPARTLTLDEAAIFAAMIGRRMTGEPVSRIVGLRGFYGRDFLVSPATLDPRPESETLIDAAIARMSSRWGRGAGLQILDIGTGTGCLLLTLLAEFPEARGVGIDPSAAALAVARSNAARLGFDDRAAWVEGRFEAVAAGLGQHFPLVVSNPPYIATDEIAHLERDVRDFDPHLALDGGADGLDVYRHIAKNLATTMAPGWILFEIGATQGNELIDIMSKSSVASCLGRHELLNDMAQLPRCVAFEILH